MTTVKEKFFETGLQSTATLFKALAHPARLAILTYLAEIKSCISGDISDELPLSRSTVNQHLKELKKVGLISGTVDGVKMNYCINPGKVKMLENTLMSFINQISQDPDDRGTTADCC